MSKFLAKVYLWGVVAVIILLLVSMARGQCPPGMNCPTGQCPTQPGWSAPSRPQFQQPVSIPQVVRIGNGRPDGVYYGSGVIVADNGTTANVLTCWHTFEVGVGKVTVNGAEAQIVDSDKPNDLALIRCRSLRVKPLAVSNGDPGPQVTVTTIGFGSGRVARFAGRVLGYVVTAATGRRHTLVVRGTVRDGDSGGPIIDSNNEIVGVIWGFSDGEVYATNAGCIRKFLGRVEACDPATTDPAPPILPGPGDDDELPLPAPPAPQPPTPDPCAKIAVNIKLVEVKADLNAERITILESNHAMLSETLRNLTARVDELAEHTHPEIASHTHPADDGPLFFVIHRDPKTGEMIPQTDPETGQTYTVQAINRGDAWTVYLHDSAQHQGLSQ